MDGPLIIEAVEVGIKEAGRDQRLVVIHGGGGGA